MSVLLADIDATCAALGYNDGENYYADSDALQCLKHLIWILRRDLENHEYRRHLGRAKVLQTDLVPMLINYIDNNDYGDVLIRLLIILTNPTPLLYRDGLPKDGNGRKIYLDLIDILQNYKTAFVSENIWSVLTLRLHKVLEVDWAIRSEEDNLLIERILVLTRNVLQVPANPDFECRADNDASIHDQIIWALHQSGMLDLILYVLSSKDENQYHLHALEIVCLLYREQTAESLADASLQRSVAEKYRDEQELVSIRKKEKQKKIANPLPARHSRFGGTYVMKNIKSVSENDVICHQSLERVVSIDFDREKVKQKRSYRIVQEENKSERRSAFSVRLCLREYCIEVLRSGYNGLVRQVRRLLERNVNSASQDDSYLLWAIKFFMEFNRLSDFQLDLVSESLSIQCFHWVLTRAQHHMDMITSDKKQARIWSKRLHLAIQTFRELLLSLIALQKLKDEKALDLFVMLQNNVCYVLEYRETILYLLMNYNETHSTKLYLRDVVETANIFIKIMEKFCQDPVVVQDKKKQRKKTNKKSNKNKTKSKQKHNKNEDENLEDKWAALSSNIATSIVEKDIQLPEENQPIPFDAASDKNIDDQKEDCMIKIYKFLKEEKVEHAIILMRSAREVWPENDCFGAVSSSPEEELMLLREIYFSKLGSVEDKNTDSNDDEHDHHENETNYEEEEEEEEIKLVEKDFRFEDYAKRLINPKVVRACTLVLNDWEQIPTKYLKSAVTILHRIAFGCKYPAMLYQAVLFRIFQQVFHSPRDNHNEELRRLGTYIVRKFVENAQTNPKIYAELLFYKSMKEAFEIEHGYSSDYNVNYKGAWSEEQENELRMLFEENQNNPETDKDVIDWILENLIDKTRTRRGVLKKLKEMGLVFKAPTKKSNAAALKKNQWKYEEDELLRNLYDEHRLEKDCLDKIIQNLPDIHSKNSIIKRMISLGLIADKSEILPKKHNRTNKNRKKTNESDSDDETHLQKVNKKLKKINISKKTKKRKNTKTPLHIESIQNLLNQIEEKFQDALDWLKESLLDATEDLDELPEDEDDGVPLVPVLDIQRDAMENNEFKKLLIAIGIQPPIMETENYWRIPIYLNAEDLKIRAKVIEGSYTESVDNLNTNGTYEENDNSNNGDDDDDDNIENDNYNHERENESSEDSMSEENSLSDVEENSQKTIMSRRQQEYKNLVFNASDDEDEYNRTVTTKEKITEKYENNEKNTIKNKNNDENNDIDYIDSQDLRMRLAELTGDSDLSDTDKENDIKRTENISKKKKVRSRFQQIIDSDSSDESNDEIIANTSENITNTLKDVNETEETLTVNEMNNVFQHPENKKINLTTKSSDKENDDAKNNTINDINKDVESTKGTFKRNRSEESEEEENTSNNFNIISKKKKFNVSSSIRKRICVFDDDDDDDDNDDN